MQNIFIILPVFNGEKYFLEQLMSIYNQTYTQWKLIFINDHSSDESENIIKKFASDYNLKWKIYFYKNKKNLWLNKTIEKWLKIIKNKWKDWDFVAYCDADDIRTRNKLETQIKYMKEYDYNISYHDLVTINSNNEITNTSRQFKLITPFGNTFNNSIDEFCTSQHVTATSIIFKYSLIKRLLPFSNAIYQDHWTMIIFSLINNKKIWYLNKKLWFYRRHETALSWWKLDFQKQYAKKISIFKDAYKLINKKILLEYINIHEKILEYYNKKFYQIKITLYILIKHPHIFWFLFKKWITYPIRKIYGYFKYKR